MSSEVSQSVECSECKYVFQDDELDQDSEKRKPCPNCGSLRRNIRVTVNETLVLHEYNWYSVSTKYEKIFQL